MPNSVRFAGLFLVCALAAAWPNGAAAQADSLLAAEQYFQRGNELFEEGDLMQAIDYYAQALVFDPKHARARVNRGLVHFKRNQWSRASDDFDKYLQSHPNDTVILVHRGQAAYMLQNFSDATHYLSLALQLAEDAGVRVDRGLAYFAARNWEAALQDFREATRLAPRLGEAWLGYGNVLQEMGDYENALQLYQQAHTLDSGDPRPIFNMGVVLCKLYKYEEAIEQFDAMLRTHDRHALALAHRAACHFHLGRFEEAAADANRALTLAPDLPEAYHALGLLEMEKGDFALAERIFTEALDFQPDNSELLAGRGLARLKLRKNEDALEDLDAAVAYDTRNGAAYYIRASLRKKMHNDVGACEDYRQANKYGYLPFPDMDGTVFCEGYPDGIEAKKH